VIEEIYNDKIIDGHLLMFDLDGTLVNTDMVNFNAYKEAILQIMGLDLELLHNKDERFTREKLYSIIGDLSDLQYKNIIEMKNCVYQKYLPKSKVNGCVLGVIERFANTNKIILATSSHKDRARTVLRYHDLINIFDHMFYKEDYNKNNKFLHIMNYLNVNPDIIIVFENDNDEIKKAISSGIPDKNIIKVTNKEIHE
jgi:beta-phosphoglucomutase-like phosphatase (HAD superfamily)